MATLRVPASLSELETVRDFVRRHAAASGLPDEDVYGVVLAVNELVTNVILHGYRGAPGTIAIEARRDGPVLTLVLRDQAPPFDPRGAPAPDTSLPIARRPSGGLGILLARRALDTLEHRALPDSGNELTLTRRLPGPAQPEERSMELTTDHFAGRVPVTILALSGSLDASSFEDLIARARELYAAGTRHMLIDLSHLTFMGSSGLVALRTIALLMRGVRPPAPDQSWEAFRELEAEHEGPSEEVKLLRPHANIRRTLEITGMDGFFAIFDDQRAAVESFR